MRLLQKLIQRRDAALADARKYQELIALVEGDANLKKGSVLRADAVAMQALAMHGNGNGNGHGNGHDAAPKKKRSIFSPAQRKRMSKRMKQQWKDHREVMLKGVRKGSKNATAARQASTEA
jgi:hypothetical protein